MVSCSMFRQSSHIEPKNTSTTPPQRVIYSDSIDNIILHANSVCWWEVEGMTEFPDSVPSDEPVFIFGYPVETRHEPYADSVLSFIISDYDWYIRDYPPVKQMFHPDVIFLFTNNISNENAGMFVSFGTGEVAIFDTTDIQNLSDSVPNDNLKYYLMRDPRLLARWTAGKLPQNEYYQTLLKL